MNLQSRTILVRAPRARAEKERPEKARTPTQKCFATEETGAETEGVQPEGPAGTSMISFAFPAAEPSTIEGTTETWESLLRRPASFWTLDMVDIMRNPTYVILDLGCTKPMGSRHAVNAFMKAAPSYGMECQLIPSTTNFTFANGETAHATQACRVRFPTEPPTWTDFDIVEQGHVPILMSLGQMKNLWFTLELTPETTYLTCPAFGCERTPLRVAFTNHLVLDLAKLKYSILDPRLTGTGTTSCLCRNVVMSSMQGPTQGAYLWQRHRLFGETCPER